MMNRAMTNNYLRECHLAAWRIKTGLTDEDYRELKAAYLARTGKSHPVFNFMWHEHSKINQKIEDVGSRMLRLEFRTLRDMQTAWRDVDADRELREPLRPPLQAQPPGRDKGRKKYLTTRYTIDSWTK